MDRIKISEGSGGKEMNELILRFKRFFSDSGEWMGTDDDSAFLDIGDSYLCFTTDSYTVSPLFFPGGNIGDLAVCGTLNDLAVMGAKAKGMSLGLIIEEGFLREDLDNIMKTIGKLTKETGVPIVTGDTKVIEKGKVEGMLINTSGVGICKKEELLNHAPKEGDVLMVSGSIGDHAVALLSERFDYETDLVTDSKPVFTELEQIKGLIKIAKDPTRGGLSGALYDIGDRFGCGIKVDESLVPIKKEVNAVTQMLGLNVYELACEGRFICVAKKENAEKICEKLENMRVIGEITRKEIVMKTKIGTRVLSRPSGRIVPRIC
ncbi:MAG: hydrogenase expression/formation protein HypE [Candidatus Woesearchaeota archaeon]